MISYLTGQVTFTGEHFVFLDVNHVGYQVFLTSRDLARIPQNAGDIKIFTHLYLKEDFIQLYGFLDMEDLELFQLLINVSGIGPKAGIGILSTLSADDVRFAVLSEDIKTITKAPGIGKKTAQRLILDLKDKISLEDAFEKKVSKATEQMPQENQEAVDEAVLALTALGYSNSDALRAVRGIEIRQEWSAEDIIKEALKTMAFL